MNKFSLAIREFLQCSHMQLICAGSKWIGKRLGDTYLL